MPQSRELPRYQIMLNRFGPLRKAIRLAGIDIRQAKINRLKEYFRALELDTDRPTYLKMYNNVRWLSKKLFGSVPKAAKKMHIKFAPRKFYIAISREDVKQKIQQFYKQHGRHPSVEEFPQYRTATRLFGTWPKAVTASGCKYIPLTRQQKYTNAFLIEKMKEHIAGRIKLDKKYSTLIGKRFGSTDSAIRRVLTQITGVKNG